MDFHPVEMDFVYFHLKSKVEYNDEKNHHKFTVNTRIKKDSVIWMSITGGPGVEVVRCLIRTDSIFVIDKMANKLYSYNFSFLSKTFNVDIDYNILQAMIVGNLPVPPSNNDKLSKTPQPVTYLLHQVRNQFMLDNYVDSLSMRLQKISLNEPATGNTVYTEYSNFLPVDSIQFAHNADVKVTYKKDNAAKETTINIQHTKAEVSEKELNFPFNVPNKYE